MNLKARVMDKYRSLPVPLRASFWFLICTVLQRSISVITTPIYTRMLTTDEYGQYSAFISWMGLLSCFITLEISSGVYMQAIVKHDKERYQYTSAMEGLTVVLVIGWMIFYLITQKFWNRIIKLETSQMLAMFVVLWGRAIFGFWSAEQRIEFKYRGLVIVTLIGTIIQPALCVVFIRLFSNKVTGLVWGIAISTIAVYISLFIKHIYKGRVLYSGDIWKYTLGFAIPLVPHYISSIILNSSDRIMIQQMIGNSEAGLYNLAYTISICGTMINQAVLQTFSPWVYQKLKNNKHNEIARIAYPLLVAIAVVNLAVVLLTPEIISIFAPPSYYEALYVMPPIALSVFFMFMYNLFACFEFYYEKKSYVSTATMVGAGLNIVLNFIFIKIYGYQAAGYTTLVCYIVFSMMHYYFMRKICRERMNGARVYDSKVIIGISVIYLVVGLLASFTYNHPIIRYSILGLGAVALFVWRKKVIGLAREILNLKKNKGKEEVIV